MGANFNNNLTTFIMIANQISDVNECGLDKGGCEYKCVNEAGSYHCACPEGFNLDHRNNRSCIAGD